MRLEQLYNSQLVTDLPDVFNRHLSLHPQVPNFTQVPNPFSNEVSNTVRDTLLHERYCQALYAFEEENWEKVAKEVPVFLTGRLGKRGIQHSGMEQHSKEQDTALRPLCLRDLGLSDPALQRTETPGGTSSSLHILLWAAFKVEVWMVFRFAEERTRLRIAILFHSSAIPSG